MTNATDTHDPILRDGPEMAARLHAGFAEAARRVTPVEFPFTLGGRPALLRTAGAGLTDLVGRPLAHLRRDDGRDAEVVFELFDGGETGVSCGDLAPRDDFGLESTVATSDDGRWLAYRRARSLLLYDRRRQHFVAWSDYADRACLYEMGRPMHLPLSIWYADQKMQVMHAGLVARDGVGVLFPGMGGSGKSTSSLTCLEAGLEYLGDDYIGLSRSDSGAFIGHSVFCSSHLEPHHLQRFERLRGHEIAPKVALEDKSLVLLDRVYPGQFRTNVEIRAIACPRVVDAETTTAKPIRGIEALIALAPSSVVMVPGQVSGLEGLGDLVAACPCFRLELGRQLDSIPRAVERILDEVAP